MSPTLSDRPLYLGLISGTSADGIDAALVSFSPLKIHFASTYAYDPALRQQIIALSQTAGTIALDDFGELDTRLGIAFADAATAAIDAAGVDRDQIAAIGSHGQTLRHRPHGCWPFSLQVGDPNVIAERCRLTVIADFRRRDVAAGGHGAPLMPAFHADVLSADNEPRAVLNLGGIANLTLLMPGQPIRGFDTGPANGLLDAWCLQQRGQSFDRDGEFAASGRIDQALLAAWLGDPWFAKPAPKSSGRDQFHLEWAIARGGPLMQLAISEPANVQASLCELSAVTIAQALKMAMPQCQRLIGCGGGVRNSHLMRRIAAHLPGITVESSAVHGLDPDFVEAAGFAWLARETLENRAGNRSSVTGAQGPRVLGGVYAA